MSLTITEALAETKTIEKRIAKKREAIQGFLARQDMVKDPLAADGGSVEYIKREEQAVSDLEERLIALRSAILAANVATVVAVNGDSRSIQEWLTWRREVAPKRQQYLGQLRSRIEQVRTQAQQKGVAVVSAVAQVGDSKPTDVLVNVSEQDLAAAIEHMETVLGTLDGQLSLKNATTTITI